MVDKGNVDKYRRSMSGLRVQNAETWGRNAAEQRYGPLKYRDGAPMPKDQHLPQDVVDKHDNNQVPTSSWLRGGNESGKPKR